MKAFRYLERHVAGVGRLKPQIELHGHRDLKLKLEIIGPKLLRLIRTVKHERQFRDIFGIFTTCHTPKAATGEAVPIRSFRTVLSKPGPAYWNAAMIRLIRPEFDGGRGEKHGEVSRGPVGKHLSSEKRQLRTAVLVGKRNNRIALRPVTEHDASGGTIAFIQFFAIHALNYTKTHPIQQSRCCIIAK